MMSDNFPWLFCFGLIMEWKLDGGECCRAVNGMILIPDGLIFHPAGD
jgi:hypothetical protein